MDRQDATARASLPKTVRDAEPAAVKQVATATKAIRDTIAAERARLDGLFVEDRRWEVAEWRTRYLGHPITGALSRSLIWRFGTVTGMPTADGTAVTGADGGTSPKSRRRRRDAVASDRGDGGRGPRLARVAHGAAAGTAAEAGVPRGLPGDAGGGGDRHLLQPVREPRHPPGAGPGADEGPWLGTRRGGLVGRRHRPRRRAAVARVVRRAGGVLLRPDRRHPADHDQPVRVLHHGPGAVLPCPAPTRPSTSPRCRRSRSRS